MSAVTEQSRVLAPYVSYKTFRGFLDSLRQGIPARIDRSLMPTQSGAIQNQILAALRYLSLIDDQGMPQPTLRQLVQAEEDVRKEVLAQLLRSSYPALFASDDFLTTATVSQFHEAFQATGAKGDTIRKNEAFFLAAASDAGIAVSPRITKAGRSRSNGSKPARPRGTQGTKKVPSHQAVQDRPIQQVLPVAELQPLTPTTRTVHLRGGVIVTLTLVVDWMQIDDDLTEYLLRGRKWLREGEENFSLDQDDQDAEE